MNLLNLSSKIKKRIIEVEKASIIMRAMKGDDSEVLFDAFRIAGEASLDFLIINNLLRKLPDLRRFKKLQKKAFLSVHEIMNIIGTDKGVILGKAKEFIIKAEFTGIIKTKKEAIVDSVGFTANLGAENTSAGHLSGDAARGDRVCAACC